MDFIAKISSLSIPKKGYNNRMSINNRKTILGLVKTKFFSFRVGRITNCTWQGGKNRVNHFTWKWIKIIKKKTKIAEAKKKYSLFGRWR
jgi:hypothetical protein